MPGSVRACLLCDQTEPATIYQALEPQRFGAPEPLFGLVRCRACGLTFLSPRPNPDEIDRYYPDSYYTTLLAGPAAPKKQGYLKGIYNYFSPSGRRRYSRRLESQLAIVRRLCGTRVGLVLDVGVGDGEFLYEMARLGWDVEGVDFSADAARHTAERLGGKAIHVGQLEQIELRPQRYNLVTLWDVLEHVYQPLETLRRALSLLAPAGALAISVPNLAALESRLLGRNWGHLDIPRHLSHFNPSSLRKALEKTGFHQIRLTTGYRVLTEHLPHAIVPGRSAMDRWTSRPGRAAIRVLDDSVRLLSTPILWMGLGPGLVATARP